MAKFKFEITYSETVEVEAETLEEAEEKLNEDMETYVDFNHFDCEVIMTQAEIRRAEEGEVDYENWVKHVFENYSIFTDERGRVFNICHSDGTVWERGHEHKKYCINSYLQKDIYSAYNKSNILFSN